MKEKEYVFEFPGTQEAFMKRVNNFDGQTYCIGDERYLDEYIIKVTDSGFWFGVERGGHSGGYWYIPTVDVRNDCMEFRGKIEYIGSGGRPTQGRRLYDRIEEWLLFVFLLPVIIPFKLYSVIASVFRGPKPAEITTEDRLYELMENKLGCTRK